jgi:hypothetical protein
MFCHGLLLPGQPVLGCLDDFGVTCCGLGFNIFYRETVGSSDAPVAELIMGEVDHSRPSCRFQ